MVAMSATVTVEPFSIEPHPGHARLRKIVLDRAFGGLLGPANFDAMYLRQAYRPLMLHTDGTFVGEVTDYLLMMKFGEMHVRGGEGVTRPTFFKTPEGWGISFIDQFARPQTIAQGRFLERMLASLEASPATVAVPVAVGDLIVLSFAHV